MLLQILVKILLHLQFVRPTSQKYVEADKFILVNVDRKHFNVLWDFPHGLHFRILRFCLFVKNLLIFHGLNENHLFQYVTLPELPAVVVFKDGTYFVYDGK